jgi:hypothetical protein
VKDIHRPNGEDNSEDKLEDKLEDKWHIHKISNKHHRLTLKKRLRTNP